MTNPSHRDDGAPVADIYRLYCTHCTFGTSVLEKRTTENADKVLGYSVRAASLDDREKIQRVFRAIERLLSYDLPKGTPPTDKLTYDAAKAPRRLVFMPRLNDHQVVGLMSYRSQDTAGRPGSYFGDFLVALTGATPSGDWSAVDCLRLWPAAYTGEIVDQWWCDSEDRVMADEAAGVSPLAPETLSRAGGPGIISDETFISFLSAEFGTSFEDPSQVIPPRWAEISAADRQLLFRRLAQATVDVLKSGKGTVTLVVEPSLAALLFYGVCRILPQRLLAAVGKFPGLSFSTYDPSPDRATTTLVATVCNGPGVDGDLPGEAYKRGFVCNTFVPEFRYGVVSEPGKYVSDMVARSLRNGALPADLLVDYESLGSLKITELESLPDLIDELSGDDKGPGYLRGKGSRKKFPSIGGKTGCAMTAAGRSLCARLMRRHLERSPPPYPIDVLEAAVDWLGDKLTEDWRAQGPLYRALAPVLPTTAEDLEALIRHAGGNLPQEIRDDAVTNVTLSTRELPKVIADEISGGKSSKKPADVLRKVVERLLPDDRIEGILRVTIERQPGAFLRLLASHFDVVASAARLQDRTPLVECLLKKAFPGGTLEPSEKWALLESCVDSLPTPIPDGVWDDPMWREDQIEKAFRRGCPESDEWRRRATAVERWAGRYDEAKPGSSLALLVPKWCDLIVTVDKRMEKGFDEEGNVRSYQMVISKASLLNPSPTPPSKAANECIYLRAAESCGRPDSDVASFREEMEAFRRKRDAAENRKKITDSLWSGLKRTRRSAVRGANRYAIPLAASIAVVAVLAGLLVYVPPYPPTVWPVEKQEQAKQADTPKTPAPKANQRQEVGPPPNMEGPRPPEGSVAIEGSMGTGAAGLQKDPSAGPNDSPPSALPPTGTPAASSPALGTASTQPNGMPAAPAIFPGAVPGGEAKDPIEQIRDAVEKQSHRGQVNANVQRIGWGRDGSPLDVSRIKLSLPKNDTFWSPHNIHVERQGGFWSIQPHIATLNMDGNGMTIESAAGQPSPDALRASLLPLIVSDSGSPQRWTWIERVQSKPVDCPIGVNDPHGVVLPVEIPSVYELRDKATLVVTPRVSNALVEWNPVEPSLGDLVKEEDFLLPPVGSGRAYPVRVRCAFVEARQSQSLLCRLYCDVGYFGVKNGVANTLLKCKKSKKLASGNWVGDCSTLMQASELWGGLAPKEHYARLLREAFRDLEAKASTIVSQKENCVSFLTDSVESRVTSATQQEKGSKPPVSLQDTVNHSFESRMRSLKAVLQTTVDFRRTAVRRLGGDVDIESFPLRPDKNEVSAAVADERLKKRIAEVEAQWRGLFIDDDDAFREWCWSAVCNNAADESSRQIRLLAALWLVVNDSREDCQLQKQGGGGVMEVLRKLPIDLDLALQIRWFPKDWGGSGNEFAKVTPWMARCRVNLGSLPPSPLPKAAAEKKKGASGAGRDGRGAGGNVPGSTGADAP